ncbi:GntR family transcriptional regulator [Jiella sp. MQZ9-1]|uniref:GntR family transcriptional regulator n=1 Tax=Jiella flava TaxID=2816857 RepID=A0A939JWI5_9HYPH|nr:GntR family transcriptional regulator [Jiella flava]MBO0663082.1 GntR family transcriptional regulator [Jiella flava]MCD2471501.1 GntR family transcriptional regulator [Jiella flava]
MAKVEARTGDGKNQRMAAYDRFVDALRSGTLTLGQMITQRELAADLELSVGALRELLPLLESEGLIQVLNQRGILLPAIDLKMIRETFQFRLALEREAASTAVETMPDETIEALRSAHRTMMDEIRRDSSETVLVRAEGIDRAMHAALIASTGNGLLQRIYETNETRMRLINLYRHALTAQATLDAFADHLAVIEALGKRDRAGAMAAIERHIHNARNRAVAL